MTRVAAVRIRKPGHDLVVASCAHKAKQPINPGRQHTRVFPPASRPTPSTQRTQGAFPQTSASIAHRRRICNGAPGPRPSGRANLVTAPTAHATTAVAESALSSTCRLKSTPKPKAAPCCGSSSGGGRPDDPSGTVGPAEREVSKLESLMDCGTPCVVKAAAAARPNRRWPPLESAGSEGGGPPSSPGKVGSCHLLAAAPLPRGGARGSSAPLARVSSSALGTPGWHTATAE